MGNKGAWLSSLSLGRGKKGHYGLYQKLEVTVGHMTPRARREIPKTSLAYQFPRSQKWHLLDLQKHPENVGFPNIGQKKKKSVKKTSPNGVIGVLEFSLPHFI